MIRGDEPFRRINVTSASLEFKWKRQTSDSGIRTRGSAASTVLLLCALRLSDPQLQLEFDWLSGQLEENFSSCVCPKLIPSLCGMFCLPPPLSYRILKCYAPP